MPETPPMRIAMLAVAPPPRTLTGADPWTALSCALVAAGHQVPTIALDRLTPTGPAGSDANFVPTLARVVDEVATSWRIERPDIVHASGWIAGLVALHAARSLRAAAGADPLPIVYSHVPPSTETDPMRARLEPALMRSVDVVTAPTAYDADQLAHHRVSRRRLAVLPAGVDRGRFDVTGRAAARGAAPRLLAIGELTQASGFETAIAALRRLPDVELLVAGGPNPGALADHPEARRLRHGAEQLGVADRVRLLGAVPPGQLASLLRSADALIHLPWLPAPANDAPLAAMACGVPVLVAPVAGAAEPVVDGITGLHLPPRRPDLLATAVRELLSDPIRLAAYGVAAADRVDATYSPARTAAVAERIYRRCLPAPEPQRRQQPDERLTPPGVPAGSERSVGGA